MTTNLWNNSIIKIMRKKEVPKIDTSNLDVVYYCRGGSNEELRYSLRSLEKNFPHRKVWVYGEKPDWCKPDEFVGVLQTRNWKNTKWDNVRQMHRKVARNPQITEDFVLFNDDFYVMKPINGLPYYYNGSLFTLIKDIEYRRSGRASNYTKLLRRARSALCLIGRDTNNYELHLPMVLNREKLDKLLSIFPTQRVTRSTYGNYYRVKGEERRDVKPLLGAPIDYDSDFLSSSDKTFEQDTELRDFIKKSFPNKSKYER